MPSHTRLSSPLPAGGSATAPPACLEIATFRARAGVTGPEVERALRRAQAWLETRPGFLGRQVALDAAGTWVDTVAWRSGEDAQRALASFAEAPCAAELQRVVDEATFRCLHATPVSIAGPA